MSMKLTVGITSELHTASLVQFPREARASLIMRNTVTQTSNTLVFFVRRWFADF